MRVLVTGGSGRIGRHVVNHLRSADEVTVFDATAPSDPAISFLEGDIRDRDRVAAALEGVDAVVHLAGVPIYTGENPPFMDINIGGTFNVLEGMARHGVSRIVFASSICTYGFIFWKERLTPDYFPIDELHPTRPDDMYGVSKLVGDELCYAYSHRYDISAICLRMATVWFPGDPYTQKFIDRLGKPELGADGIWNHVDARDVARAFRLALEKDVRFDAYNIGARTVASYTETLDLVRQFYPGVKAIKNHERFLSERDGALFDIGKARRELQYEPLHSWRDYV